MGSNSSQPMGEIQPCSPNYNGKQFTRQQAQNTERCYDPNNSTLKFVEREDDHDFLCADYKSKRAEMSCGHTVTPTSLFEWCERQLDQGKIKFECGQPQCKAVWHLDEVCKMALLTKEEENTFETKIFQNYMHKNLRAQKCPSCKSWCVRENPNDLSVRCSKCGKFDFCWQCLRKWKGPTQRSDRCDNEGCNQHALETLRNCPFITFENVEGVNNCPSFRACPTCGVLVEHNTQRCKNIRCTYCGVEFCFVCLKTTAKCSKKNGTYYKPCPSGVAPRQTSIPVMQNMKK